MAATGTAVGTFTTIGRNWKITLAAITTASTSQLFLSRGYGDSSFVLKGVLGGATLTWQGSNDSGITFVNIGTSITSLPAGGTITPGGVTYRQYQLNVAGGGGTTLIAGDVEFTTRG